MADINVPEQDCGINIPNEVGPIYQLSPKASAIDIRDHLSARLSQLHALLVATHGCGYESFNQLSDPLKDNYLWCCAAIAEECETLVDACVR